MYGEHTGHRSNYIYIGILLVVFHCKYNLYTGKIIFTDSVVKDNDQHLQVVYMYGKCGKYIYYIVVIN